MKPLGRHVRSLHCAGSNGLICAIFSLTNEFSQQQALDAGAKWDSLTRWNKTEQSPSLQFRGKRHEKEQILKGFFRPCIKISGDPISPLAPTSRVRFQGFSDKTFAFLSPLSSLKSNLVEASLHDEFFFSSFPATSK